MRLRTILFCLLVAAAVAGIGVGIDAPSSPAAGRLGEVQKQIGTTKAKIGKRRGQERVLLVEPDDEPPEPARDGDEERTEQRHDERLDVALDVDSEQDHDAARHDSEAKVSPSPGMSARPAPDDCQTKTSR